MDFNLLFLSAQHSYRKCLMISGSSSCVTFLQKSLNGMPNHSACLPNRLCPVRRPTIINIFFLFSSIRFRDLLRFHSGQVVLVTLHAFRLLHLKLSSLINNFLTLSLQVENGMPKLMLDNETKGKEPFLAPSSVGPLPGMLLCPGAYTRVKGNYLAIT